jgi:hypothetical protein
MNNILRSLFVAAGFATAVAAYAAVSFDPATGQGFIGRGDVIDHPTLGKDALVSNPVVTLEISATYELTIEWMTGPDHNRKTHTQTRTSSLDVVAIADVETRRNGGNGNITGYKLLGYAEESQVEGAFTPPQVGDVILDNDNIQKTITNVEIVGTGAAALKFVAGTLVGWFDL